MTRRMIAVIGALAIFALAQNSSGVEETPVSEPVLHGCSVPVTIIGKDGVVTAQGATCSEVNGECMDGDDGCSPCNSRWIR